MASIMQASAGIISPSSTQKNIINNANSFCVNNYINSIPYTSYLRIKASSKNQAAFLLRFS
ncbi:MAG: hypothetical protein IPO37_23805 [Saprospiraceae bacterium]|nr:hypothetical protein [Saprospiraceae bacterium]